MQTQMLGKNLEDFSEEEIYAFIESIDFYELESIIEQHLDITGLDLHVKTESRRNRIYVSYESDNLIDQCGMMSNMFSSVVIDDFGASISVHDGQLVYFPSIHMSWEHIDGGSNGSMIPGLRTYWNGKAWV